MSSGAPPSLSAEADDEFGDGGVDDAAALTLVEAAEKVQAAAEREKKIAGLIADHEAELKEIARLRKQKGSGHPGNSGRVGTTNHKRLNHELSRLKRGKLPGEADGAPVRSQEQLRAAAQLHAADHPGAGNSTRHDYAQLRAEMYGDLHARGGGADGGAGHDDLDGGDGGSGDGGGDGGDGGDGGAWDSSDDDDPQPRPKEAKVSKAQQDFIVKCAGKVTSHTADNYKFMPPCASIAPRASAALFMLEMVVVWLPHIIWRKLGIPPQPPCPEHGFPDEDENGARARGQEDRRGGGGRRRAAVRKEVEAGPQFRGQGCPYRARVLPGRQRERAVRGGAEPPHPLG